MSVVRWFETHDESPPMRPMRGPDDAAERGQGEEAGSLAFWPPRVRGLFGLLSAMLWERRGRVLLTRTLKRREILSLNREIHS